ncbi:hypothetical protein M8C21_017809, partial [Ambrosia artemisiifolia]
DEEVTYRKRKEKSDVREVRRVYRKYRDYIIKHGGESGLENMDVLTKDRAIIDLKSDKELSVDMMGYGFGVGVDRWVWEVDGSGKFSVRSIRDFVQRQVFKDRRLEFEWNS